MSAFAAGCAICGTDLEAHRREQAARRVQRPAVTLPRLGLDDDFLTVALVVFVTAVAPLFGLIIAVLAARDPRRANVRTWLIVLACIAVAFMLIPALRFGLWYAFL